MSEVKNWSSTADDNNNAVPNGAPLNWTGANLGPWARATMAAVHKYYSDPAWVAPLVTEATSATNPADTATFTVSSSGTLASYFNTGRLLRITTSGGTKLAFVSSHSFSSGTNTVTVSQTLDNGALSLDGIEFFNGQTGTAPQAVGAMAFGGSGTTSERNTKFGTASAAHPDGLMWHNTELSQVELLVDGAWCALGPVGDDVGWTGSTNTNGPDTLRIKGTTGQLSSISWNHGATDKPKIQRASGEFTIEGATSEVAGSKSRLVLSDADNKIYFQQLPSNHGTTGWGASTSYVDAVGIPGYTSGKNVGWYKELELTEWTVGGSEFIEAGTHGIVDDAGSAARPRMVTVTAVATGAPTLSGDCYSVGDEVDVYGHDGEKGINVVATTTHLKYKVRGAIRVVGNAGDNGYNLEEDKWKLIFRAWR